MSIETPLPVLKPTDFASDQDVRWCPGCGDYGILAAIQFLLPELGVNPDEMVFVSARVLPVNVSTVAAFATLLAPTISTSTG